MTTNPIQAALDALKANHEWHQDNDDYEGYTGSDLFYKNTAAIAALAAIPEKEPVAKVEGWRHEVESFDGQGYSCLKTIVCAHPKPNWFDGHEVTKIIKSTPLYASPLPADQQEGKS